MRHFLNRVHNWYSAHLRRRTVPAGTYVIFLAGLIGVLGGYAAVLFTVLIEFTTRWTVEPCVRQGGWWLALMVAMPALGLLAVSWFTRRFATEAEGFGVPEVITAVARHDGVIRPRVCLVKLLASGICIGTGGSVGRAGPIVQIGSSLGSMAGQLFKLSASNIKVLVAAGAAAGISATFNAPLAGVIFASQIIMGNFAAENLTPIVVASVLANVVQLQVGEHGLSPAFPHLYHRYEGAWLQLPSYVLLGLLCGLAAVGFTKLLYGVDDLGKRWLPKWWVRALVCGVIVGAAGVVYPAMPPALSNATRDEIQSYGPPLPSLLGVGFGTVDHALHLETQDHPHGGNGNGNGRDKIVKLEPQQMLAELWWLLPLILLKPMTTSITLSGGGSGGIFAPSLFVGATLGAAFGLVCNLLVPESSANPGVYAIVGMGAVVAGTTHGMLSAIMIVYEMTNDYQIILPIMAAAGLASFVSRMIDSESIYHKKLSRRGESISRAQDVHRVEHVMVRDVMVREFPTVKHTDNVSQIVKVARANSHIESLPVMNDEGKLIGIIRPEDLHRVLDSDISPQLVNAQDISMASPISVSPDENLLEAMRDFGTRDVDTLPVESGQGPSRRLVGLLQRGDVMLRYRVEMLRRR